jgi:hypothetical protein
MHKNRVATTNELLLCLLLSSHCSHPESRDSIIYNPSTVLLTKLYNVTTIVDMEFFLDTNPATDPFTLQWK